MTEKRQETMPEILSIMLKFQKFQLQYLGPFLEVVHFDRSDRSDQNLLFHFDKLLHYLTSLEYRGIDERNRK